MQKGAFLALFGAACVCLVAGLLGTTVLSQSPNGPTERFFLKDAWRLCTTDDEGKQTCRKARVPGHAILDVAEGDPYVDSTETTLGPWVAERNWTYVWRGRLPNDIQRAQTVVLVFESVDTVVSKLTCNGISISKPNRRIMQNAFRQYRFHLPSACVHSDTNFNLTVTVLPSTEQARQLREKIYNDKPYPHTINYQVWSEPSFRNLLRKPASDFGWDWGPSFPGAGIPGKVYLLGGSHGDAVIDQDALRIEQVFNKNGSVSLSITCFVQRLMGMPRETKLCLELQGEPVICQSLKPKHSELSWTYTMNYPRLWYPRSSLLFGFEAELYTLRLFSDVSSKPIFTRSIGLRKVRHVVAGGKFHFFINDELIDWRGFNVIPFDAFKARTNWSEVNSRVREWAEDMNINSLRIWGGGYLPDQSFYDTCDRLGILVWQDLPWACAVFPATPEFLREARAETKELVLRLAHHPSIVVWGGNNEVEASLEWFPETMGEMRPKYERDYTALFLDAVFEAVREAAGHEAVYVDSSPSNGLLPSGKKRWGDVSNPKLGDVHFYNYSMNCENLEEYPEALFVSEHGVQSLPKLLEHFVTEGSKLSSTLAFRQRHEFGFEQLDAQSRRMFSGAIDLPLSSLEFSSMTLLSQIVQGRCFSAAISSWRAYDENHGVLLWQLNDVWPGVSWSVLEYDLSWKISAHMTAESFSPLRLMLVRKDNLTSVRVQAYSELKGKHFQGYLRARPFDFVAFNGKRAERTGAVGFHIKKSEQEIITLPGSSGWYVEGTFFMHGEGKDSNRVLNGWILPANGFRGLVTPTICKSLCAPKVLFIPPCKFEVSTCEGSYVEPYVILSLKDSRVLQGHFDKNAFFAFPGEVHEVKFKAVDPHQNCSLVYENLEVRTLRQLLCQSMQTREISSSVSDEAMVPKL